MLTMEASLGQRRSKNHLIILCITVSSQLLFIASVVDAGSGGLADSKYTTAGFEAVKLEVVKNSDKMIDSLEPKSIEVPSVKYVMAKVDSSSLEMPKHMSEHEALMMMPMEKHSGTIDDLSVASGHKKYVLVKKKPKMKKIKMEVYKPKMKYKKIKIKVPVKKMKKKKVKGYMVKKEHDHY